MFTDFYSYRKSKASIFFTHSKESLQKELLPITIELEKVTLIEKH